MKTSYSPFASGRIASSLFFLLLLVFSTAGLAATQRMLLLPGSVTVAGGGSGRVPARCLDSGSGAPVSGKGFSHAPSSVNSARVSIGGAPPIPLQDAIDQGRVRIEGDVEFSHLRVVNPNPDTELTITVDGASVIAPDKNYYVEDLASLRLVGSKEGSFEQSEVWRQANQHSASVLGVRDDFPDTYDADFYNMVRHAHWAKGNVARLPADRAVVIHRVIGTDASKAASYVVFSGAEAPRVFKGSEIEELARYARRFSPRLVLAGKGEVDAFHAVRLAIEISPAAGGGGDSSGGARAASGFDFEPPKGFPFRDRVYRGTPWNLPIIADVKADRLKNTQKFFTRGEVTATSKTRRMLTYLMGAVRRVVENKASETSPLSLVEIYLKNGARNAARDAFADYPDLKVQEMGNAEITWVIDKQFGKQEVVRIQIMQVDGEVYVAASVTERYR